jgi:hypothetical protein
MSSLQLPLSVVIPNLFRENAPPSPVLLKQVQHNQIVEAEMIA